MSLPVGNLVANRRSEHGRGSRIDSLTLTLRAVLEIGVVLGFAYWRVHAGDTTITKIVLGIGAPLLACGFWSLVDFRQAGSLAEPLRLAQELAVTLLAALALYGDDQHVLALGLAALSVVYHVLVYASGARLLNRTPRSQ